MYLSVSSHIFTAASDATGQPIAKVRDAVGGREVVPAVKAVAATIVVSSLLGNRCL